MPTLDARVTTLEARLGPVGLGHLTDEELHGRHAELLSKLAGNVPLPEGLRAMLDRAIARTPAWGDWHDMTLFTGKLRPVLKSAVEAEDDDAHQRAVRAYVEAMPQCWEARHER